MKHIKFYFKNLGLALLCSAAALMAVALFLVAGIIGTEIDVEENV